VSGQRPDPSWSLAEGQRPGDARRWRAARGRTRRGRERSLRPAAKNRRQPAPANSRRPAGGLPPAGRGDSRFFRGGSRPHTERRPRRGPQCVRLVRFDWSVRSCCGNRSSADLSLRLVCAKLRRHTQQRRFIPSIGLCEAAASYAAAQIYPCDLTWRSSSVNRRSAALSLMNIILQTFLDCKNI